MKYRLTGTVISDEGLKRKNNEDNFSLFGKYRGDVTDNKSRWSCVTSSECEYTGVYDGMGGEDSGEVASLIAAGNISGCDYRTLKTEGLEQLRAVNRMIVSEAQRMGARIIGTTMVGLYFYGDKAVCCNVGDSRCYLFRNNKLVLLSKDHSEGQRLVDMGVDPIQARSSRAWHQLTQHFGIPEEEFTIEPYYTEDINIMQGDVFLLCSDGVSDMILDDQIESILQENKSEEARAQAVVDVALANGGKDNTTVMIVTVREEISGSVEKVIKPLGDLRTVNVAERTAESERTAAPKVVPSQTDKTPISKESNSAPREDGKVKRLLSYIIGGFLAVVIIIGAIFSVRKIYVTQKKGADNNSVNVEANVSDTVHKEEESSQVGNGATKEPEKTSETATSVETTETSKEEEPKDETLEERLSKYILINDGRLEVADTSIFGMKYDDIVDKFSSLGSMSELMTVTYAIANAEGDETVDGPYIMKWITTADGEEFGLIFTGSESGFELSDVVCKNSDDGNSEYTPLETIPMGDDCNYYWSTDGNCTVQMCGTHILENNK